MSLIGSIEPFNPKESEITAYLERLDLLCQCNNIAVDKKVSLLLTLLGGEAYGTLKDLLAPELPSSKTFEELKTTLENHYSPKRLVIAERFKFYSAVQEDKEDVKSFVARLKSLAQHSAFGGFLHEALRDRLVCGMRSEIIKRKLLTEENLSFERAVQIAASMEIAEGQIKIMGTSETGAVSKINFQKNNKQRKPGKSQLQGKTTFNQGNNHKYSRPAIQRGKPCKRCTRSHPENWNCPAINWECYSCHQKGHTAKSTLCKNKIQELAADGEGEEESETTEEDTLELGWIQEAGRVFYLKSLGRIKGSESLKIKIPVEGKSIIMEVDSGACRSVMHISDYRELFSELDLEPVNFKLKVVTGENVVIVGQVSVNVSYQKKQFLLPLVVLQSKSRFIPLLGRNWLNIFNPSWKNIIDISLITKSQDINVLSIKSNSSNSLQIKDDIKIKNLITETKRKFAKVFMEEPKTYIKDFKAEVTLKEGVSPIFHRAYEMPYAVKPKVEEEIAKMVKSGILSKVTHSDWASPVVVVPKKNSSDIRLCVDFKRTVNRVIDGSHCVLPLPEDIFACLSGSKVFSVIDLKGAYQQLVIGEESKKLFTINTHLGLFRYNRLTYGISAAPGIFQSCMETILAGISNAKCYLDDILIYGSSLSECHYYVQKVLERLSIYNVKVNESKCKFFKENVEFLGYKIDSRGIHPLENKVECIKKAPSPQNVTQLKAYLGLLNYYGKFIPMLSARLKPLYELCGNPNVKFGWSKKCEEAFQESKKLLTSSSVLTHFNPKLPIYVTCDASGYGVGAVLSHKIKGDMRPVLFASSTLSKIEQRYSNIERESLAIIFALKKFHKYLYGRKFTLITDHRPLQFIFGKNKGIPVTAAARITRWALSLSAYDYEIEYKQGKLITNADGLSRLPMVGKTEISEALYSFSLSNEVPFSANDIAFASNKDLILAKVIELTLTGWPNSIQNKSDLQPYFKRRHELSVENNCLLVGSKVVIPKSLQRETLKLFHEQHLGIVRTKMLMRAYCWWPGINEEIEQFISTCDVCQQSQNFSNSSTLLPWPNAPCNFYRVHIDFFHKYGYTFLILIDCKSKWLEVKLMEDSTNAKETIIRLKEVFAVFGLPVELVTDNGPPFGSIEFVNFCQANGITLVKSPPYHPQSNGIAERGVQTVKKGLKKALFLETEKNVSKNLVISRLLNFLFTYRTTPSSVTGMSPAQDLFKIRPRTRFDIIKPSLYTNKKQSGSKAAKNLELYALNQSVYVKNIQTKLWQLGKVVKVLSSCTYLVQVGENIKFVHASDMRRSLNNKPESQQMNKQPEIYSNDRYTLSDSVPENTSPEVTPNIVLENKNQQSCENAPENEALETPGVREEEPAKKTTTAIASTPKADKTTRSGRIIKPPVKLNL